MRKILFFIVLIPFCSSAQPLEYNPNNKVDQVVSKNYYDTDFIYIKNSREKSISLNFEMVENTFPSEWSETICTNLQCFNTVPDYGSLGSINPTKEAYISLNLSANEELGTGFIKFLITSPDDLNLHDTLRFEYTVTETGNLIAGPWAKINYGGGVLTVLLENPYLETNMMVVHVDGKVIFESELAAITSLPLRDYSSGIYLIYIKDENDRIIRETIFHP